MDSGCLTSILDGAGKTTMYTCYADGEKDAQRPPTTTRPLMRTDARRPPEEVTSRTPRPINTLNGAGQLATIRTKQSNHTNTYDLANRLKTVLDAQQQLTQYGYDFNGNLTSITDGLNRQTLIPMTA